MTNLIVAFRKFAKSNYKCGGIREDADNMAPARGILVKEAYARPSTRLRSCAHTRARAHAHTQKYVILVALYGNGVSV
jgi:hypothetical protein